MKAQDYWQLFMETGAPELYLIYHSARKMEMSDVFESSGAGTAGYNVQ